MDKNDIEKLHNIAKSFRKMSAKIKLIALLDKAKDEYEKNNYAQCIADCEEVLLEDKNNPIALRGIGCALQSSGKEEKALEYYKKALKYSKNIPCKDENILNIAYLFLLATLILIGFFGFYILSSKNKDLFNFKKTHHISSSIKRFGWLIFSPPIIIYCVIILLEILSIQLFV